MERFLNSILPRYKMSLPCPIATGSFGEVYMCFDTEKEINVAVKRIPFEKTSDGIPSAVLREISVLRELDHENVVRLLDVIATANDFALVLEYMDYDLKRVMERDSEPLDPRLVKGFLFQILQGLSYCHSRKVMHRDLKPQNLLFDRSTKKIKIADFGFARTFDIPRHRYSTEVTTLAYRAPEILLRAPYTAAVDIWSVGCILAEMVNGEPLFDGAATDIMTKIIRAFGVPSEGDWPGVESRCLKVCRMEMVPSDPRQKLAEIVPGLETDPEGLGLLSEMLCTVPSRRISAYDALMHPYFNDVDLDLGPIFYRV